MIEGKRILVQSWLRKAAHDLRSARILVGEDDSLLDTAIYHCQQAAEKAVKGFLVYHDTRFEKTHDIEHLIELARPKESRFSNWMDVAKTLTPYGTMFRYPGEVGEPELGEFEQALRMAENLYAFVLSLLPSETHP